MLRRNHVRRVLERIQRAHPEKAAMVQQVLDSENLLSQVHAKIKDQVPDAPPGHPIIDWLWAHKEIIIQIIITIIGIVAGGT